jgi:hypothetical protein
MGEVIVMQAAFQLVVNCKMVSLECIFQGAEKKVQGVLNCNCRENKGEKMGGTEFRMSSAG